MPQPNQVLIVVNKKNELIEAGDPVTFIIFKIMDYLEQGHIIRQISEAEFNASTLKMKQCKEL